MLRGLHSPAPSLPRSLQSQAGHQDRASPSGALLHTVVLTPGLGQHGLSSAKAPAPAALPPGFTLTSSLQAPTPIKWVSGWVTVSPSQAWVSPPGPCHTGLGDEVPGSLQARSCGSGLCPAMQESQRKRWVLVFALAQHLHPAAHPSSLAAPPPWPPPLGCHRPFRVDEWQVWISMSMGWAAAW